MEPSTVPAEDLLRLPWLPITISGCQLLSKSCFGDASYRLLLTDLLCVWEERMDTEAIQRRAQELNKRLRAPVKAFFSHLCDEVQPFLSGGGRADGGAQISLSREEGNINLRLKSELAGLPFHWEFHCKPAPISLVCVQLVRPLLAMSGLLQQQVDELGDLLVRKDAEIQDYRENGATLSRERLQTEAFEEQTYREDFMAKALPLLGAEGPDALGFHSDLQRLYGAVVARPNARKRKLSQDASAEEPNSKQAALASSSAAESAPSKAAGREQKQRHNGQEDFAKDRTADKQAVQQSQSVTSESAERPPAKPKKKKVGLFR